MSDTRFQRLEDAILDEAFPEVDLALRRGRHIDASDGALYTFLLDAEEQLEPFYQRYGCDLVRTSDGYFYLLPTSDALGRKHLSRGEMIVGQALTLLYLDPAVASAGGIVLRDQLLAHLAGLVGTDALLAAFLPKRKKRDERIAEEMARGKVAEAIRRLGALGFVEALEGARLRLRPALLRFADPVRGGGSPEEALVRLVAAGEAAVEPDEVGEAGDVDAGADDDEGGAGEADDEGELS